MLPATTAADSTSAVYLLTLKLSQHEKFLLLSAIQAKVDERIKSAKVLFGSDTSKAYFEDAGRLTAIARDLSNTLPE